MLGLEICCSLDIGSGPSVLGVDARRSECAPLKLVLVWVPAKSTFLTTNREALGFLEPRKPSPLFLPLANELSIRISAVVQLFAYGEWYHLNIQLLDN